MADDCELRVSEKLHHLRAGPRLGTLRRTAMIEAVRRLIRSSETGHVGTDNGVVLG
jgi:hypothetical protein